MANIYITNNSRKRIPNLYTTETNRIFAEKRGNDSSSETFIQEVKFLIFRYFCLVKIPAGFSD